MGHLKDKFGKGREQVILGRATHIKKEIATWCTEIGRLLGGIDQ